jgi:hypothetical protein
VSSKSKSKTTAKKTTKTAPVAPRVYVHQPRMTAMTEMPETAPGTRGIRVDAPVVAAPVTESGSARLGLVAIKQHTLQPAEWGRPLNGAAPEYKSRPTSLDEALAFFNGEPRTCAELAAKAVELGGAPQGVKGSPYNATSNHMLARVQQGRAVKVGTGRYAIAPHFRAEVIARKKGKGK